MSLILVLRGARVKHEVACTLLKRAPGITSNSSEELLKDALPEAG